MTPRQPQRSAHSFRIVDTIRNDTEKLSLDSRPLESKLLAAVDSRSNTTLFESASRRISCACEIWS